MKKRLIILLTAVCLIPGFVFPDIVTFKLGYFIPRAQSDLWEVEFENMDFVKSDFQGTNFSLAYEYFLSNQLSLMVSIDGYTKQKAGFYEGYVGETIDGYDYAFDYGEGFPIGHVFSVSITPIQLSMKLTPLGRKAKLIPFIGGGVGLYLWHVKLQGEIIDFSNYDWFYDPNIDQDVVGYWVEPADLRDENRLKVGFHVLGGFMMPIGNRISLEAEFKYNLNIKHALESFVGFQDFDLSAYQIAVGLNYWF
ncbi:MAG: hypothetical protein JW755_09745 [Candidatus Aminicenantes bacterium]|nr:hypothetical protein [Candidatus Aminicenantes bacterium]